MISASSRPAFERADSLRPDEVARRRMFFCHLAGAKGQVLHRFDQLLFHCRLLHLDEPAEVLLRIDWLRQCRFFGTEAEVDNTTERFFLGAQLGDDRP